MSFHTTCSYMFSECLGHPVDCGHQCYIQGNQIIVELEHCKLLLTGHSSDIVSWYSIQESKWLLTASREGELILWDLKMGKSLYATNIDYEPLSLVVCDHLVFCTTLSDYLHVFSLQLEMKQSLNLLDQWIACLCVYSEIPGSQSLLALGFNGELSLIRYDEQNQKLDHQWKWQVPDLNCRVEMMQRNTWDGSTLLLMTNEECLIASIKHQEILARVSNAGNWIGCQFVSPRTMMLWNNKMQTFFYYLGNSEDLVYHQDLSLQLMAKNNSYQVSISHNLLNQPIVKCKPTMYCQFMPHQLEDGNLCPINRNNNFELMLGIHKNQIYEWRLVDDGSKSELPLTILPKIKQHVEKQDPWGKDVTVGIVIMDKYLAFGRSSGEIMFLPLSDWLTKEPTFTKPELFNDNGNKFLAPLTLKGHSSAVRCLTFMNLANSTRCGGPEDAFGKNILVSAADDCTVRTWNLETGALTATFLCHGQPSLCLIPLSLNMSPLPGELALDKQAGGLESALQCMRFKHGVLSIGMDQTLCIIDVEDLYCKYRFSGHVSSIRALHWKAEDEVLIVECCDRSIYVWQLKTGHLDRAESGATADDLLQGADYSLIVDSHIPDNKQAIHGMVGGTVGQSQYFVLTVNVKKLISNVYHGKYNPSPPSTPQQERSRVRTVSTCIKPSESTKKGFALSNLMEKNQETEEYKETTEPAKFISEPPTLSAIDASTLSSIFGVLLNGFNDKELNQLGQEFGVPLSNPVMNIGSKSPHGHFTLVAPKNHSDSWWEWKISSHLSACYCLSFMSLFRCFLEISKIDDQKYVTLLNAMQGCLRRIMQIDQTCSPSMEVLAKYWQDPVADVQEATRNLTSLTLSASSNKMQSITNEWFVHLQRKSVKLRMRAAVVLGILGVEQPSLLTTKNTKLVAEALEVVLKDEDAKNRYRCHAIELFGKGFNIWMPYINAAALLRYLIQLTGLGDLPKDSKIKSQPLSSQLMVQSRQAVVQIAATNGNLFISTLTFDLVHAKSTQERVGCLKLLGLFINKKPLLLYPHLSLVLESTIKALDPNNPFMRESLQSWITLNLSEMVKVFPMVSFHAATQRIAVGTMEGSIVLYDLKTATRIQVLQAHSKSVSCVSLSKDGKLMASYSVEENVVQFWQPAGGILGTLVGVLNANASQGVGHLKFFRKFNVGPPRDAVSVQDVLEQVQFEWISDRSLKLKSVQQLELSFSV